VAAEVDIGAAQAGRQRNGEVQRVLADLEDLVGMVRAAEGRRTVPLGGEFEAHSRDAVSSALAASLAGALGPSHSSGDGDAAADSPAAAGSEGKDEHAAGKAGSAGAPGAW
jgi:hypothetical protein